LTEWFGKIEMIDNLPDFLGGFRDGIMIAEIDMPDSLHNYVLLWSDDFIEDFTGNDKPWGYWETIVAEAE
jgi:hypothetical protein